MVRTPMLLINLRLMIWCGWFATDVFTYTISDTVDTATATLTITVTGVNDTPVAVDDIDTAAEDATVTKTGSQNDVLNDDTDADDSAF